MDNNKLKIKQCGYCPLRGRKETCISVLTGHSRICQWVDPESPLFRAGSEPEVARLSGVKIVAAKSDPKEEHRFYPREELEIEERKYDEKKREKEEREKEEPTPEPNESQAVKPAMALITNENAHALVYESAIACTHRTIVEACCGSRIKCGPDGKLAGLAVGVAECYPCMAKQLGIKIE